MDWSSITKRRILRELKDIQAQKHNDCPIRIELVDDSNLTDLRGFITGPKDTPYQHGTFCLSIKLPNEYPFHGPRIKFLTKIWHPNVNTTSGAICFNNLEKQWASAMTLQTVLITVQSLLSECELDETQEPTVARQLVNDFDLFERTARYWTHFFAMGNRQSETNRVDVVDREFKWKLKRLLDMGGCDEERALVLLSSNMWNLEKVIMIFKSNVLNDISQFKRWRQLFISVHAS